MPCVLVDSPNFAENVVLERRDSVTMVKDRNEVLPRDLSPASSCSLSSSSSGSLNEAPASDKDRSSPSAAPFDLFVDTFDDFGNVYRRL